MSATQRVVRCGDAGGLTAAGEPCGCILGLGEDGRCPVHSTDPARAEATRDSQALGGAKAGRVIGIARRIAKEVAATTEPANLPKFAPDSLERVALWLQWAARAVATGEISTKTAAEVTKAMKELRPTLSAIGMEVRLKQLERDLAAAKKALEREGGGR